MSKTEAVRDFTTVINDLVIHRAHSTYGAVNDETMAKSSVDLANISSGLVMAMHDFFAQIDEGQTAALFGYTIGRAMGFSQMIEPNIPAVSIEHVSKIFAEGIKESCEITKAEVKHGVATGAFTIEQLKNNTVKTVQNVEKKSTRKGTERKIILPH